MTAGCRHVRCLLKALELVERSFYFSWAQSHSQLAHMPTTVEMWKVPSHLTFAVFNRKTKIMGKIST